MKRAALFLLAMGACALSAREARADVLPNENEVDYDRLRHFTFLGYPFGLSVGRLSAEFEYLPVTHHALTVKPFAIWVDLDVTPLPLTHYTETGYGVELGYRYYTGQRG